MGLDKHNIDELTWAECKTGAKEVNLCGSEKESLGGPTIADNGARWVSFCDSGSCDTEEGVTRNRGSE